MPALLATFSRLGMLRVMLLFVTLLLLFTPPGPGTRPVFHGWEMVPTLLVPTLVPMVFMLLLLDVLMCTVFMLDKRGAERVHLKRIALLNLLMAATLMFAWYPYFRAIL